MPDPNYSDIAKQYLQPAQAPQVAPVAPAQATRRSADTRGLELGTVNERIGNQDDTGQSFLRTGEAQAQGAGQAAGAINDSRTRQQQIHETAMTRVANNQALQDQYRKMAEADLSKVKDRGMANWGPLLSGIIGAAAGAAGNDGLAQGMGMLSNVIERSAQAKAQAANATFQGHQELARTAMADSANAVDAGTSLMAQEHELAARHLEQIGQEATIPQVRETALRLAQGARDQGLQLRQAYYTTAAAAQEHKELAAAQAAKAQKKQYTVAELEALAQSGQIRPEQYKELLGLKKQASDIDQSNEAIRKSQAEKDGKAPTEAETKRDMIVEGGRPAYQRLAELEGGANWGATNAKWVPDMLTSTTSLQQRADINALTGAVLRNESGASISEGDLQAMVDAHPVNSGDETIRKAALADLMNHFKSMDVKGRTSTKPKDEQAAPAADLSKFGLKKKQKTAQAEPTGVLGALKNF